MTDRARAMFAEFEIEVVAANVAPGIGQTRALVTLERIIKRHGEPHARFVVMTLSDTSNSKGTINETTLWCVSDVIRAAQKNFPDLIENDTESWFKFWDGIPLGWLEFWCLDLEGVISKRHALAGMCYERLRRQFGGLAVQPDLLDDRRSAA